MRMHAYDRTWSTEVDRHRASAWEDSNAMKLLVMHGKTVRELDVEPSTTVQDVMAQLQDLTGALTRTQKLISKGKVLGSGNQTLEAANLKDGAKLMLLCGAPGTQTQVCRGFSG